MVKTGKTKQNKSTEINYDLIKTYVDRIKKIAKARDRKYVEKKLLEEFREYQEFPSDEEVIDIINVSAILLAQHNIGIEQLLAKLEKRKTKYEDRL